MRTNLTLNTMIVAIAAIVCGCASTPVRYLTLDMNSSESIDNGGPVIVETVELSDALRRPELLVQARETEIEYYSDAHWVSSLTELVTEKLEAEFGAPAESGSPTRIRVKLWHFGEDETAEPNCARVKLSVSAWSKNSSLRDDADWSRMYEECVPILGDDVSEVAAALSTGLEVIALQIAEEVARNRSKP